MPTTSRSIQVLASEGSPLSVKMVNRSCSCPWMSPTMVILWSAGMLMSCSVFSPAKILRV